jgi:subtilisin family serine protease
VIADAVFEACFRVTATAEVSHGKVVLRAGERVRLGSGFRVARGARLAVSIDPRLATGDDLDAGAPAPPRGATPSGLPPGSSLLATALALQPRRAPGAARAQQQGSTRTTARFDDGLFYDYFDRRIPLQLVDTELGVRFDGLEAAARGAREHSVLDLLPGWGLADRFGAWSLFSSQEASGTELITAGVEAAEAIERLRGSPASLGAFLGPVLRGPADSRLMPGPEILVRLRDGVTSTAASSLFEALDARVVVFPYGSNRRDALVTTRERDGFATLALAARLHRSPLVHSATPDFRTDGARPAGDCASLAPPGAGEDPTYGNNWNLTGPLGIGIEDAWARCAGADATGQPLVTVAVVGDGIELGHPDLAPVSGADFVTDEYAGTAGEPVTECDNHETTVAGVIAMRANALGSRGAAPGVALYSARAHYRRVIANACRVPFSQLSWVVDALDWVALDPAGPKARVVNYSWNWLVGLAALDNKLQDLRAAGVAVFVSSGNGDDAVVSYPSSLSSVIAAGASDRDLDGLGDVSRWVHPTIEGFGSNYGIALDLVAPGGSRSQPVPNGGIWTTDRSGLLGEGTGAWIYREGTSYAAPAAAAVAALMVAAAPGLTADLIEHILCKTAFDVGPPGRDDEFGCGLLDATAALEAAKEFLFSDGFEAGNTNHWTGTKP